MKKTITKIIIYSAFLCNLIVSFAAPLSATVNQTQLNPDQVLTLTISAQAAQSNLQSPDLSPLQKNFTILSVSRNQSLNIVNNNIVRNDLWIVSLLAKKKGRLIIPSIHLGKYKTKPIPIVVSNKKIFTKPIFMEVNVSPKQVYINSQITYRVKLFYRVPIQAAALLPPRAKNATVERVARDKKYVKTVNGKKYRVFQREYLIYPNQSGKLKIMPAVLRAQILSGDNKQQNYNLANLYNLQSKPVEFIAPKVNIDVKHIPDNLKNHWWLPATSLTLKQKWQLPKEPIKIGSVISRLVTIKAGSVLANQLPEIQLTHSSFFNNYKEQGKTQNVVENNQLFAKKTLRLVYIVNKAGDFSLPAITVYWWNVNKQQWQKSTLLGKEIKIGITKSSKISTIPSFLKMPVTSKAKPDNKAHWNGIIYLLIGLSVLLFLIKRHFSRTSKSLNRAYKKLLFACKNNQSKRVREYLIEWVRLQLPDKRINTLYDVLDNFPHDELKQQIEILQKNIYSPNPCTWHGKPLLLVLKKIMKHKSRAYRDNKVLPDLNPD